MASSALLFESVPERAGVDCAHCGLPVPSERVAADASASFCCTGCASVHAILAAAGLSEGFRQQGQRRAPAQPGRSHFQEFDDPAFDALHCKPQADGSTRVELVLSGVHCSACVWLVERLARLEPAVQSSRLDLSRGTLELCWFKRQAPLSQVARSLDSLGYRPHALGSSGATGARLASDRSLLLRLGVAGAAAGNVMLMAFALYSGEFADMTADYAALFRWGSLLIATPTVFWTGSVFFRGAWAALRTRTPHMDLPVSIGILVGYLGGALNTLRGSGEVYFDTLCTLIFLLLIGRYLQSTHQRRSARASELIQALAPTSALLVEGATRRSVLAQGLAAGAHIEILPEERVPADGVVVSGSSSLDTALLTGEALPVQVTVGDRVHAGCINQAASLVVRVEAAGAASRLGRLMQSVEATQRDRAPIVRLADRVAGHFVFAILLIAAFTLLLWLHWDPKHAVDHAVALLVVTCPCALGMATPLSVSSALRRAAELGILFKGGEFIEELAKPGLIVFDKTGTLTEGRLELVHFLGSAETKALLRAAESRSGHPIARAVQRSIPENQLVCEEVRELDAGLMARVGSQELLVGALSRVEQTLGGAPEWVRKEVAEHAALGRTPIVIAVDGVFSAVAAFSDRVREDASAGLQQLRALGFRFQILSGDHQRAVNAIEQQLRMPFLRATGHATPEDKLATVKALRASGERVLMVGDGVNDAAAMAAANVGIAVHGGAEACLATADVFMTSPGLAPLALAAAGARRTVRTIRRGIALSLAYNLVGIGLAASGVLSPLLAAVLMPLSSVTVVSVALRSRTFRKEIGS